MHNLHSSLTIPITSFSITGFILTFLLARRVVTTKVKTALFNDKDIKSSEISVQTFKGRVQLSGFVSSAESAKRAVEVTRRVQGVRMVENDLRIK